MFDMRKSNFFYFLILQSMLIIVCPKVFIRLTMFSQFQVIYCCKIWFHWKKPKQILIPNSLTNPNHGIWNWMWLNTSLMWALVRKIATMLTLHPYFCVPIGVVIQQLPTFDWIIGLTGLIKVCRLSELLFYFLKNNFTFW